jgi:pimeloyl-ACP methyl ester carboxylesterase
MKIFVRLFQLAFAGITSLHLTSSYAVKSAVVIADPAYAHAQRLVDIDHGRRLNLYCVGNGSPTVVFDAGLGNWSQVWGLVQPAIAKKTQACAYDRAGLGFSDPANRDSSSANIVDDLHRLLVAASIKPPYIVVGHSYGGMSMRLFADLYFNETAGMVLVDPTARDLAPSRDSLPLLAAVKMAQDDGVTEGLAQTCIAAAEVGFLKESTVYKECVSEDMNPRYSENINAVYLRLQQTPNFWRAWQSEKISIDTSSADQLRTSRRNFGSLPLVVLTQSDDIGPDPKASRWVKAHDEIASSSTVGVNRIVPDSSHMIMLDQPQAVIDAIDDVLDQVLRATTLR